MITIGGFSNVVYCTIVLKTPDGHSAHILLQPECTYQYLCLYCLVIMAHYLTSESGGIVNSWAAINI